MRIEDTVQYRASTAIEPARESTRTGFLMSTPLLDVWEAAASSPYQPSVSKDSQFTVGAFLLLIGMWGRGSLSYKC